MSHFYFRRRLALHSSFIILALNTILLSMASATSLPPEICEKTLKVTNGQYTPPSQIAAITLGSRENPALVLIHGDVTGKQEFDRKLQTKLAQHFYVISYDQRGYGDTDAPDWSFDSATLAMDLQQLLKGLRIERAHLVGTTFGARTAVAFAGLYPGRALSLTIDGMALHPLAPTIGQVGEALADAFLRSETRDTRVRLVHQAQTYDEDHCQNLRKMGHVPVLLLRSPSLGGAGIKHITDCAKQVFIYDREGSLQTIPANVLTDLLQLLAHNTK